MFQTLLASACVALLVNGLIGQAHEGSTGPDPEEHIAGMLHDDDSCSDGKSQGACSIGMHQLRAERKPPALAHPEYQYGWRAYNDCAQVNPDGSQFQEAQYIMRVNKAPLPDPKHDVQPECHRYCDGTPSCRGYSTWVIDTKSGLHWSCILFTNGPLVGEENQQLRATELKSGESITHATCWQKQIVFTAMDKCLNGYVLSSYGTCAEDASQWFIETQEECERALNISGLPELETILENDERDGAAREAPYGCSYMLPTAIGYDERRTVRAYKALEIKTRFALDGSKSADNGHLALCGCIKTQDKQQTSRKKIAHVVRDGNGGLDPSSLNADAITKTSR